MSTLLSLAIAASAITIGMAIVICVVCILRSKPHDYNREDYFL